MKEKNLLFPNLQLFNRRTQYEDDYLPQKPISLARHIGYHVAEFVLGFLDRRKEREQEELNHRHNILDAAKADFDWSKNHLQEEISVVRGELTYLAKKCRALEEEITSDNFENSSEVQEDEGRSQTPD
jgi:hypothetical protein